MGNFLDTAPREYLSIPTNTAKNNDFALVVEGIMNYAASTTENRHAGQTDTEYAAMLLDLYSQTDHGQSDIAVIDDITFRMQRDFSDAFNVLLGDIAPTIDKIIKQVDKQTALSFNKKMGYTNSKGKYTNKAPKLYLLDIEHLYKSYQVTATDFAKRLCSKYNYNVEYLNDTNVSGLISRITPVDNIKVSDSVLKAIMEDVIIKISSDSDNEVTINTNQQDDVVVEGATPNIIKEDDQSSVEGDVEKGEDETGEDESSAVGDEFPAEDDDSTSEEETPSEDNNINVNVNTDNDAANITVTINDEQVSTEQQEDAELMLKIVRACFNADAFNQLKKDIFVGKGYVKGSNLVNALKFIRNDLRETIELSAYEHLTPIQIEMLLSNLEQVKELQMAGVIYLDINSVQFADTIIIDHNLLNKNLVNRAMNDGIDIVPIIRNYLRVYHNKNKDDIYYNYVEHKDVGSGVSYSTIISSSYDVEQKLINAKESTKAEHSHALKQCRINAFRSIVTAYVNELANRSTESQLNVGENDKISFLRYCDDSIQQFCSQLEHDENVNAEDMLYQLVVNRWYAGTLVAEIYNRLSEGIRIAAAKYPQLTPETMAMVKAEVIADIGSEYLYKIFVRN